MDTPEQNSQDAFCAEILREARQQAEELARRARQEADALLAQAQAEAERLRQERLAAASTEAARRRELILATVPAEVARLRSTAVEALLETICEQARQQLAARQEFDYRTILITVASEAISQMTGERFIVKLPGTERRVLGDRLSEAVTARVGRSPLNVTISEERAPKEGLMVQDTEGRQSCDEDLEARLERLWPQLRREIALRTSLVSNSTPGGSR